MRCATTVKMRAAFLLLVLAGCPMTAGPSTGECETDADCAGNVCARDGLCYPANEVREVKTTWTIQGRVASPATCGPVEDLQISFSSDFAAEALSYAPVPCANGQWLMDKLPREYRVVELGKQHGVMQSMPISATGEVVFDLRN